MRFIVISRPKNVFPREQLPQMLEQLAQWRERYRSKMEVFEFFNGGGGGFGIVDVSDEAELYQMVSEFPFAPPISDVEVRPIINGDKALVQIRQTIAAMAGS